MNLIEDKKQYDWEVRAFKSYESTCKPEWAWNVVRGEFKVEFDTIKYAAYYIPNHHLSIKRLSMWKVIWTFKLELI